MIRAYAPEKLEPIACERQIQKLRGELTICSEAMAFFRIALCLRILSWRGDESTKFGKSLFACNFQIQYHNKRGVIENVVPRGASLMAGATAEKTVDHIKTEIFDHGRQLWQIDKPPHIIQTSNYVCVCQSHQEPILNYCFGGRVLKLVRDSGYNYNLRAAWWP